MAQRVIECSSCGWRFMSGRIEYRMRAVQRHVEEHPECRPSLFERLRQGVQEPTFMAWLERRALAR